MAEQSAETQPINSTHCEQSVTYFSNDDLKKLNSEYQSVQERYEKLLLNYVELQLKNEKAQEFAIHGFPRRLGILVRCINNVYVALPPERKEVPTRDELSDATINVQAFILNVFGALDNLAWIWVSEKGLINGEGLPMPKHLVGLSPKHKLVRASFSEEFQAYINGLDDWFGELGNFRDAIAHRIPLYIPPYVVPVGKEAAYRDFEKRMTEAIKRRDLAEHDRLSIEQMKLVEFRPWIQHSFEEKAKPIVFHAQLLADFAMTEELGKKMLLELNR